MRIAVIDVGSNSVRLMMSENGNTLYKKIIVTRLGEGISLTKTLTASAIKRTAEAVFSFTEYAKNDFADKILIFATAAVRSSVNGKEFVDSVFDLTGIKVDVVSGEVEAQLGLLGALNGNDGGIIDIGGASTEITVSICGKTTYSYSLDLGVVRLLDLCGQNEEIINTVIQEKIVEFGNIPNAKFYGIGGSATSLAAIDLGLEVYNPNLIDGYVLTKSQVDNLSSRLINMTVEERKKLNGLQPERAEVIAGGAVLLKKIMEYIGIDKITVSEKDNLEGYLITKNGVL